MNKKNGLFIIIIIIIIIVCYSLAAFSQDAEFHWQMWPSFSKAYTIEIHNKNNECVIQINSTGSKDSVCSEISKDDSEELFLFLSNYSFKTKGSCFTMGTGKEYVKVKILKDKNWIVLKGDTVRLNSALGAGLMYDKDSLKYYYEIEYRNCITDGSNYEGIFQKNNKTQMYSLHSGRMSEEDYKLNQIICKLIRKYFPYQDYSVLLKDIDSNKPVPKEYQ